MVAGKHVNISDNIVVSNFKRLLYLLLYYSKLLAIKAPRYGGVNFSDICKLSVRWQSRIRQYHCLAMPWTLFPKVTYLPWRPAGTPCTSINKPNRQTPGARQCEGHR